MTTSTTSVAAAAPRPGRREDVWGTTVVGWHAAFGAMLLVGALAVLPQPGDQRWTGWALLALLGGAYAVLVLPGELDRGLTWRPVAYVAVAVAVTAVAWAQVPVLSLLLFILYPQMWLLLEEVRWGALATGALSLSALAGSVVRLDGDVDELRGQAAALAVSTAFSLVMGFWIARVIDQSADRAALIAELDSTRAQLAAAHHDAGVAAERERWARDVHDTVAQSFTSVVLLARRVRAALPAGSDGAASLLDQVEDVAREGLAESRALVAATAPVGLEGADLAAALERLAQRFAAETGVRVEVGVTGDRAGVPREVEVVLLRAAQEALANVRKHAGAQRVALRLSVSAGDAAAVEVVDDGTGFALQERRSGPGGYGLPGMRARVEQAGGAVEVESAPGEGTAVRVRVPLARGSA